MNTTGHNTHNASAGIPEEPVPANIPSDEDAQASATIPRPTYATRAGLDRGTGIEKGKVILLGGGLLIAVLFFAFTKLFHRFSPKKAPKTAPQISQQSQSAPKGSVTPLIETVRPETTADTGGQVRPGDIKSTSTSKPNGGAPAPSAAPKSSAPEASRAESLRDVPSFSDTQQRWEEPKPYGETRQPQPASSQPAQLAQTQTALSEPSLVFVCSQRKSQGTTPTILDVSQTSPILSITPGTRIQAKLETQISTAVQAPVVAVVEYTYAVGDRILVPAGTRVYGQLQQADASGFVGVKFDEIELLDGAREKIDAVGASLDLGPIKGTISGKNTGRNALIRAASGIGSVGAMLSGNNVNSSFSEGDLLRERLAQNIGNTGDTELLRLNANSRVVVSVPADTKIYIVFTKHADDRGMLSKMVQ